LRDQLRKLPGKKRLVEADAGHAAPRPADAPIQLQFAQGDGNGIAYGEFGAAEIADAAPFG